MLLIYFVNSPISKLNEADLFFPWIRNLVLEPNGGILGVWLFPWAKWLGDWLLLNLPLPLTVLNYFDTLRRLSLSFPFSLLIFFLELSWYKMILGIKYKSNTVHGNIIFVLHVAWYSLKAFVWLTNLIAQ